MNLPHVTEAEHHHEGFTLFFVTFVLILFNTLPHTLFGWWTPLSFLPMIPLYFLSLKKTLLFSAPAAFIAGLLQDSLTGVPFGIWPLSFLIVCLSARLSAPLFATSKLIIFAGWVIAVFFCRFHSIYGCLFRLWCVDRL